MTFGVVWTGCVEGRNVIVHATPARLVAYVFSARVHSEIGARERDRIVRRILADPETSPLFLAAAWRHVPRPVHARASPLRESLAAGTPLPSRGGGRPEGDWRPVVGDLVRVLSVEWPPTTPELGRVLRVLELESGFWSVEVDRPARGRSIVPRRRVAPVDPGARSAGVDAALGDPG